MRNLYTSLQPLIRYDTIVLGLMKKEEEELERRMPNRDFFYFARCVRKPALYSDLIHLFDWKSAVYTMVVFQMRDIVHSARYSSVCNVLRLWKI